MVDVEIRGSGPGSSIVGRGPGSRGGGAGAVGDDVGAVALEDSFARVAGAGDGDPVGEEVAGVAWLDGLVVMVHMAGIRFHVLTSLGTLSLDGETGEKRIGTAGRRDVGRSALLHRGSSHESREGRRNKDRLHDEPHVVSPKEDPNRSYKTNNQSSRHCFQNAAFPPFIHFYSSPYTHELHPQPPITIPIAPKITTTLTFLTPPSVPPFTTNHTPPTSLPRPPKRQVLHPRRAALLSLPITYLAGRTS